jgi:hypothetical protein
MPEQNDSGTIPIALEPLYELIKANIMQLERADRTDEVARALMGLEQAKKGLESARCPGMFLRVTFKPERDRK